MFLRAGGMWFIEIFCVKQVKVQFILFISERDKMLQLLKTACETHFEGFRGFGGIFNRKNFTFFLIYIFLVGKGGLLGLGWTFRLLKSH